MKLRIVARFLSAILSVITAAMFVPCLWAMFSEGPDLHSLLLSAAACAAAAVVLRLASRGCKSDDMGTREAFAAVTFAWVLASALGALPYFFGGYAPTYTDAYFEAMSGFTTTGSTILINIEAVPRGTLLWRAMTQWLGGMGIVVLTIALLPILGVSMNKLFKAESPGPVLEKSSPRIQEVAIMLWKVYVGLTVIGVILLAAGGMSVYESVCHLFTTVSTGGYSPLNASIGHYKSAYFDWVLTALMFLSGANFNLHLLAIKNRSLKPYKDPEFLFYLKTAALAVAAIAAVLYARGFYGTVADSLRFAAFQAVSMMTTTGFVTADYSLWPVFTQVILILLMIIGGCAGSTAGAIKCVRVEITMKQIAAEIKKIIHPQAVVAVRVGNYTIDREMASSAAAFIALYMMVFIAAVLAISATGQDFVTSISSVATTLGNVGPGLGAVGPVNSFAGQNIFAKWVFSFCMLCGRLELYTVLVLFTKDGWCR